MGFRDALRRLFGRRRSSDPPPMDPFAVGEPWRHHVKGAQRARRRFAETIEGTREGPLRDRLADVATKLDHGLEETWEIARRGHDIDQTVRRLDPTGLASTRRSLQKDLESAPTDDVAAALESVRAQEESADRLKQRSAEFADRLRLTQTRLDELVARAAEISVGAGDTDRYEHDVDDLVVELEGLRLAIEETNRH